MAERRHIRVLVAPDSFKECLDAPAVAEAIAAGVRRAAPDGEIFQLPLADGGEGTAAALVSATGGHFVDVSVTGPMGEPVRARYGLLSPGNIAVVEMAAASGLTLVPEERRDPSYTTTYGTGELIRRAIEDGAKKVIVGLGGSATNDGGAGMAEALGYRFLDRDGRAIARGGLALASLDRIDSEDRLSALDDVEIVAACDVDTLLCGPGGASQTYGPQKGARPDQVVALDAALDRLAGIVQRDLGVDVRAMPGGGAAGGLGAGLVAFAGATLRGGFDLVAEACGLEGRIAESDIVITGEGRFDGQSLRGKAPIGVARIGKALGKPVVVLAGSLGNDIADAYREGVTAAYSVCSGPMTLDEARRDAATLLDAAAENAVRLWRAGRV